MLLGHHQARELPGPGQPSPSLSSSAWTDYIRGLTAGQIVSWALDVLKPELLSRRKRHGVGPHEISSTAWLDGLRGWAALSVCIFHVTIATHPGIASCYGAVLPSGGLNVTPAAWPIVRLLWSGGPFAVLVFYSISGIVLPRRLIGLLHQDQQTEFMATLHSAMCRRPMRLLVPVIWSTLLTVPLSYATGISPSNPPQRNNLFLDLVDWTRETAKFLYFYRDGDIATPYNYHTWTIPIELRGSMFLFTWLFALSQTTIKTRVFLTFAMVWYLAFAVPGAMYATFFAGMVTAELDLVSSGSAHISLPWDRLSKMLGRYPIVRSLLFHAALVGALYLGSEPSDGNSSKDDVLGKCHGWVRLGKLTPDAAKDNYLDFWWFIGAWLLVVACKKIAWLRRSLERGFSQYLGRNSFALYLLHGTILKHFLDRLFYMAGALKPSDEDALSKYWNRWYDAKWFLFTNSGPAGLEPNFLFCLLMSVILFLYAAELGTRFLDTPSVRFSKWVYNRFLTWKQ